MSDDEEWVPLLGYEGVISVSTLGRVRSEPRILKDDRKWPGTLLKPFVGRSTYLEVSVPSDKPHRRRIQVHRAVCLGFHGEPPTGKSMALHRNGDKFDNRPENLYWGDYDDNMRDRISHGRHFNAKTHCKRGHELTEDNVYVAPQKPNARYCRKCRRIRHQKWYEGVRNERSR